MEAITDETGFFLVCLVLSVVVAPGVAAQDNSTVPNSSEVDAGTSDQSDAVAPEDPLNVQIGPATVLVAAEYDDARGVAEITVRTSLLQDVTVADAGVFVAGGGQIERRTERVSPGRNVTLTVPVTKADGTVAVSISTPRSAYGHLIEVPTDLLPGEPGRGDAPAAGSGVAIGAFVISTGAYLWYRYSSGGVSHEF